MRKLTIAMLLLGACGGGDDAGKAAGGPAPGGDPEGTPLVTLWDWPDGGVPEGWRAEGTNQQGPVARWEVEGGVLRLVDPGEGARPTFNLCWTETPRFGDGTVEVRVKAGEGEIDRGGGPIWRAKDKDNYYIARWNPLEDNFRVYKVVKGERIQLASADVKTDPEAWHSIRIRHAGSAIECFLDGKRLLEATDDALPDAGGVGVWAKADARTSFEGMRVARDQDG